MRRASMDNLHMMSYDLVLFSAAVFDFCQRDIRRNNLPLSKKKVMDCPGFKLKEDTRC